MRSATLRVRDATGTCNVTCICIDLTSNNLVTDITPVNNQEHLLTCDDHDHVALMKEAYIHIYIDLGLSCLAKACSKIDVCHCLTPRTSLAVMRCDSVEMFLVQRMTMFLFTCQNNQYISHVRLGSILTSMDG